MKRRGDGDALTATARPMIPRLTAAGRPIAADRLIAAASLIAVTVLIQPSAVAAQEPPAGDFLLADDPGGQLVEAHLAVSPVDARHLVATAMLVREPDFSVIDCVVITSFDGFETTTRHDLGMDQCGDPWVAITREGTALLTVLGDDGISVYRSEDGGMTWPSEPLNLPGAHDHEMMTVDRESGAIYVVSGLARRTETNRIASLIYVARSTDDGVTFSERSTTSVSNLNYEAMTPAVGSDGTLFVPLQDHHRPDGGRLQMRRSWMLVSNDGGASFSTPRMIDEGCNRRGPVGWPTLDVHRTAERDRLLWLCEFEEGDGISLTVSDDRGERWSERMRVDPAREGAWTKVPAVAVGPDGMIAVTWFDRAPAEECHSLVVSVSTDAGETFSAPSTVSARPACPIESDVGGRFPAGGDYIGLVPVGPATFRAVWADARTGDYRLYHTVIRREMH